MADSKSLTELGAAITGLVLPDQDPAAVTAAHQAVDTLHRLAPNAPPSLAAAMGRAEQALNAVIGHPDTAQINELTASFEALGKEAQTQCDFPLG